MINRKIEIFLVIMGMAVFFFFGVTGATMINVHDDEMATDLYEQYLEDASVEEVAEEDLSTYDEFVEALRTAGIIIIVLAVITVIVGIVSVLLLRNDKRPKIAGVILLAAGIFIGFLQFFIALVASLFYVIAGLMALFRKPKISLGE
ncbi:DUF4064 domain-containing protein [Amphibacillus indicireducens]|uniref:DUF4064 domain-containing protein n=1 Tax=Amphibacillus indicireducens TaxID=1076330 RepID=A0ABP7VMJ4_9BACI